MTSSGQPGNPYDVFAVRHRWLFIALIVMWALLVVFEIIVIIFNLRDHVSFGLSSWVGTAVLILMATMLIRVGRLRRSVRH